MRRTDTYRTSAISWGRQALLPRGSVKAAVVALLPAESAGTSSLAAMAQMFMEAFDPVADGNDSIASGATRWLLTEQGIDVLGLATRTCR